MTIWCDAPVDIKRLLHECKTIEKITYQLDPVVSTLKAFDYRRGVVQGAVQYLTTHQPINEDDIIDISYQFDCVRTSLKFITIYIEWMTRRVEDEQTD